MRGVVYLYPIFWTVEGTIWKPSLEEELLESRGVTDPIPLKQTYKINVTYLDYYENDENKFFCSSNGQTVLVLKNIICIECIQRTT